jgi:hypothetical protein
MGAIFLGVIALICLVGWRRSETRFQKLLTTQEQGIQPHNT